MTLTYCIHNLANPTKPETIETEGKLILDAGCGTAASPVLAEANQGKKIGVDSIRKIC